MFLFVTVCVLAAGLAGSAGARSEIPAGTRFMVELRDKLEANKIKPGKKFEARTVEALRSSDGSIIPAGAKLKGRVSYVKHNDMVLRFEQIDTGRVKVPIAATVRDIVGERDIKRDAGEEGDIRASGHRGRDAAIGGAVGGGIGAGVGAAKDGGKGAAAGAGIGGALGAIIGATRGGKDLVLQKGTRLDLELDRSLIF